MLVIKLSIITKPWWVNFLYKHIYQFHQKQKLRERWYLFYSSLLSLILPWQQSMLSRNIYTLYTTYSYTKNEFQSKSSTLMIHVYAKIVIANILQCDKFNKHKKNIYLCALTDKMTISIGSSEGILFGGGKLFSYFILTFF